MKQITTFLCMLAMLSCLSCANDGKDGPAGAEGRAGADGKAGADGRNGNDGWVNNVIECAAGDYDSNRDGVRDFSIECHNNGNRKSKISYLDDGVKKSTKRTFYESNSKLKTLIYYFNDGVTKNVEITFYESNGNRKALIYYRSDGVTRYSERTYYENGKLKTRIFRKLDGTKYDGYPECYKDDGKTKESCTQAKYGCTRASDTCIN